MLQRLQARQRVQRWCTMVGVIVTRVLLRHRQREMREAQQQHKLRRQQMLSEMQIRGTAATMRELRARQHQVRLGGGVHWCRMLRVWVQRQLHREAHRPRQQRRQRGELERVVRARQTHRRQQDWQLGRQWLHQGARRRRLREQPRRQLRLQVRHGRRWLRLQARQRVLRWWRGEAARRRRAVLQARRQGSRVARLLLRQQLQGQRWGEVGAQLRR